jgi:hypothetical protein
MQSVSGGAYQLPLSPRSLLVAPELDNLRQPYLPANTHSACSLLDVVEDAQGKLQVLTDQSSTAETRSGINDSMDRVSASDSEKGSCREEQTSGDLNLEETMLPSIGSRHHASDTERCRPCYFHMKKLCQNGFECPFCHYSHTKPKGKAARSKKKPGVGKELQEDDGTWDGQSTGAKAEGEGRNASNLYNIGSDAFDSNSQVVNAGSFVVSSNNLAHGDQPYEVQSWDMPQAVPGSIIARILQKPLVVATTRLPCQSQTCATGLLPRCPLCGRWRVE